MAIRTYSGRGPIFPSRQQRKIDQAFEQAGCARQDGDKKDEERWLKEARLLQQGGDPGEMSS
jgi:hypothetical protein